MRLILFKRHRFPPDVIQHAVWLYFLFTLSIRDVEELLAQCGVKVSREAVRCSVNKFGPLIAANLRRHSGPPTGHCDRDEMVVKIAGRRMHFSRAVDNEGGVLDALIQKRRNKDAAFQLLRKLLKHQGGHPESITTDKLASYRAAARELGLTSRRRPGRMRENNRVENSHLIHRKGRGLLTGPT